MGRGGSIILKYSTTCCWNGTMAGAMCRRSSGGGPPGQEDCSAACEHMQPGPTSAGEETAQLIRPPSPSPGPLTKHSQQTNEGGQPRSCPPATPSKAQASLPTPYVDRQAGRHGEPLVIGGQGPCGLGAPSWLGAATTLRWGPDPALPCRGLRPPRAGDAKCGS